MSMPGDRVLARLQLYRNDAVARSPECDVRCMLPTFGLHHVKLHFDKTNDKCLVTCLDPVNGAYLNNTKLDVGVEYEMQASDVLILNDRKFGIVVQEQLRPTAVDSPLSVEQTLQQTSTLVNQCDGDTTNVNTTEFLKCVLGKSWDTQDQLSRPPPAESNDVAEAPQLEQLPQNDTTRFQVPESLHLPASAEAVLEQHCLMTAPQLADHSGALVPLWSEANASTALLQTSSEPATSAAATIELQPQSQPQIGETILHTPKTVFDTGDLTTYGAETLPNPAVAEPRDLGVHSLNAENESPHADDTQTADLLISDKMDTVESHSNDATIGESLEFHSSGQQKAIHQLTRELNDTCDLGSHDNRIDQGTDRACQNPPSADHMTSTLTTAIPDAETYDQQSVTFNNGADRIETEASVVDTPLAANGPAFTESAELSDIPKLSTASEIELAGDIHKSTGRSGPDSDVTSLGSSTSAVEMVQTGDETLPFQVMSSQNSARPTPHLNSVCDDRAPAPETMEGPAKSPSKTSSDNTSDDQNALTPASPSTGTPTYADDRLGVATFVKSLGPISLPSARENAGLDNLDNGIMDNGEPSVELTSDPVSVGAAAPEMQSASGAHSPSPMSPVVKIPRTPDVKAARTTRMERTPRSRRAADVPETPASTRRRSLRKSVASSAITSMSPAIPQDVDKIEGPTAGLDDLDNRIKDNGEPSVELTSDPLSVGAAAPEMQSASGAHSPSPMSPVIKIPRTPDVKAARTTRMERTPRSHHAADVPETPASTRRRSLRKSVASAAITSMSPAIPREVDKIDIDEVPTIPLKASVFATVRDIDFEPHTVETVEFIASREISMVPVQPSESSSKPRGDHAVSDEMAILPTCQMNLFESGAENTTSEESGKDEISDAIVQDSAITPAAILSVVDDCAAETTHLESTVRSADSHASSENAVQMLVDGNTPARRDTQDTDLAQSSLAIPDVGDQPLGVAATAPLSEATTDDANGDVREEQTTTNTETMIAEEVQSNTENLAAEKADGSAAAAECETTAPGKAVSQPATVAPSTRSLRSRGVTKEPKTTSPQPAAAADDKEGGSSAEVSIEVAMEVRPRLTRAQKAAAEAKEIKTPKRKVAQSKAKVTKKPIKDTALKPVPETEAKQEAAPESSPQEKNPSDSLDQESAVAESVDHSTVTGAPLPNPADVSPSTVAGRKRTRATAVCKKSVSPSHKPNSTDANAEEDADAKAASNPEDEPEQPAKRMTRRRLATSSTAANDDACTEKDEGKNPLSAASQENAAVSASTTAKKDITETKDKSNKPAKILPQKRTRSAAAAALKEDDHGRAPKRAASRRGQPVPVVEPIEASEEAGKDDTLESEEVVESVTADPPERRGRATRAAAADESVASTDASASAVVEKASSLESRQSVPEEMPAPVRKGRSAGPAKAEPAEPRTTRKRAEAAAASVPSGRAVRGLRSQKNVESGPVADKPAPKRRGQLAKIESVSSQVESDEDKPDAAPAMQLRGGRTIRRAVVAKAEAPANAPKDEVAVLKTRPSARAKKATPEVNRDEQENANRLPRRATRSTPVVDAKGDAVETSETDGSEDAEAANENAPSEPEDLPPARRTRARATAPAQPAPAKAPVRKTKAAAAAVKAPAVRTTRARAARNAAAPAAE
ncbi:hypothetical protein HDU87_004445 [Geranomyces variabilis]|uniref:FHA domain-containing protein n=1 Tax=Geranomyces variabilis TaxID=109894 RepID=A0AAD5TJJ7_9FUNG|nr:hypothetical protein HDU87_004445 [Geranomyces variabilis]